MRPITKNVLGAKDPVRISGIEKSLNEFAGLMEEFDSEIARLREKLAPVTNPLPGPPAGESCEPNGSPLESRIRGIMRGFRNHLDGLATLRESIDL